MTEQRMLSQAELRADEGRMLVGYAARFDVVADIGPPGTPFFREVIRRGAFSRALAEKQDVRALFNHGEEPLPLGRTSAGTLRLSEDNVGLRFELDVPDTTFARDLLVSIQRGDVSDMSFAFRPVREVWDDSSNPPLRELLDVDLFDISPVVFPAYQGTSVGVRSAADVLAEHAAEVQVPSADAQTAERDEQVLDVLRRQLQLALLDR